MLRRHHKNTVRYTLKINVIYYWYLDTF